jgi:hypothetical protein
MPQLTLYAGPLSLFSRKVEIALREKNLEFEQVLVPSPRKRAMRRGTPRSSPPIPNGRSRCWWIARMMMN